MKKWFDLALKLAISEFEEGLSLLIEFANARSRTDFDLTVRVGKSGNLCYYP
jgi:hypothetical protein